MSTVQVRPFEHWIISDIISFITAIISLWILVSEITRRRNSRITFATKWLRVFSSSCLALCFASQVCYISQYFPGFCIIFSWIGWILLVLTVWSLGLYQLSRLYYCFADSNQGYPKWVFSMMIIIGTVIVMTVIFSDPLKNGSIRSKCGYDDNYALVMHPISVPAARSIDLTYNGSGFMLALWDLVTLVLYISKIRSLVHNSMDIDQNMYKRILTTLRKIIILTLFYQISGVILLCIALVMNEFVDADLAWFIWTIVFTTLIPVLMSISMYLMMGHNQYHYVKFLKMIRWLRLHWICCKWSCMVIDQLEAIKANAGLSDQDNLARRSTKTQQTHTKTEIAMSQVIAK